MQGGKWEDTLIKGYISRNIDLANHNVKALKSFMLMAIPKESALLGSELKFVLVEGT
jgi:hypothetical protein